MSTAVMPVLAGMGYPVVRTPVWDTDTQKSISGKQSRLAYYTSPLYEWSADVNVLRSLVSPRDFQALIGFFNARQGSFDSFLYTDADDNAVTGQGIATGDGTTQAFQLVRAFGGFTEPVLAPNVVSNVYMNGIAVPPSGLTPPSAPTLGQVSGGSLGSYGAHVKIAYVNAGSGVTQASSESTFSVSAGNLLTVKESTSAPAGAGGFYVYVGGTSGSETLQNPGSPVAIGGTWTEPTSGIISGSAAPSSNTTGYLVNLWGTSDSNGPGVVRFLFAPSPGQVITADFSYYWPCRFLADKFDFSLDFQGIYSVKKLNWGSVKN